MNVDDLLEKMEEDMTNGVKVIYVISGYYRNFALDGFVDYYPFIRALDLTNEEVVENAQTFLNEVDAYYKRGESPGWLPTQIGKDVKIMAGRSIRKGIFYKDGKLSMWLPVQFTNNPYVFAFFNNCIYAGQLGVTTMPSITVEVKCYHVNEDGSVHWQMDDETGLINARYVDAISDRLSEDFSKLIDIKLEED